MATPEEIEMASITIGQMHSLASMRRRLPTAFHGIPFEELSVPDLVHLIRLYACAIADVKDKQQESPALPVLHKFN